MSNPNVNITFDTPDPETCPATYTELVADLQQLVDGEIEGEFISYVTGASTPAVDDQDKAWHRTDASGRPLGTFLFYSGTWRRQYSGLVGQVSLYNGDPGVDFDGTGLGIIGGEFDGWALMNGANGTDNLSDKFVVAAKMDDLSVGYPVGTGPWQTGVSGATTQEGAGVHEITLDAATTFRPATAELVVGLHTATGNAPSAGGPLYGANLTYPLTLIPEDAGNPVPPADITAIPTLPPWFALAYIQFRGYT